MGTSTNGQICYGIVFDEEQEFPWLDGGDNDMEEWWYYKVHGYAPPFEIFNEHGNYIGGVEPPKEVRDRYFAHLRAFKAKYPLPVVLVNYCSGDYPMYILAVPKTVRKALRGDPTTFDPTGLTVTAEEVDTLLQFCAEHGLEGTPQWVLSSYWG